MNSSPAFRLIAIACGLIIISANTATANLSSARSPELLQALWKVWADVPIHQSHEGLDVLNGRNPNYQPNQPRVASRVVPTQTTRLDNLGLSVTEPAGLWEEAEREPAGSTARYMITREDPKIVISLAGEQTETRLTNSAAWQSRKPRSRNWAARSNPERQRLSAGGINGVSYSATVTDGEFTTYYAMWVATHNGHKYKLAVYGDKHDKTKIDAAMAQLRSRHASNSENRRRPSQQPQNNDDEITARPVPAPSTAAHPFCRSTRATH